MELMVQALRDAINRLDQVERLSGIPAKNVSAVMSYRDETKNDVANAYVRLAFKGTVFACSNAKPEPDPKVKVRWTDVRPDAVIPLNDHE